MTAFGFSLDDTQPGHGVVDPRTEDLITTHLPLVGHIVRDVVNRLPSHVSRDDLVSAGTLALVLAARGFDSSRGVPFGRFAAIRIRGAVTDELRTMDWASRSVRAKAREMESVRGMLAARLARTPAREEIAHVMGLSMSELDALDTDLHRASVLSLQSLTVDESADLLPAQVESPDATVVRREELGMLRDAIAELPERMRIVVEQYFFGQRKMAEIAVELGVTESRISQLRTEALKLLRAGMEACTGDAVPAPPARGRERVALRQTYCAAVANRSTLAQRLTATNVVGEFRPSALHDDRSTRPGAGR